MTGELTIDDTLAYLVACGTEEYEVIVHSDRFTTAEEFAHAHNVDCRDVYKSVVVRHREDLACICLRTNDRIDVAKVRDILRWKKVSFADERILGKLGMRRLGVTPLATCWQIVILDDAAQGRSAILVGGTVGFDIRINPAAAVATAGWQLARIRQ